MSVRSAECHKEEDEHQEASQSVSEAGRSVEERAKVRAMAVASAGRVAADEDALKKLYPAVNEAKTPLPRAWSSKEKYNYIGLSQNNLRVHYKGKSLATGALSRSFFLRFRDILLLLLLLPVRIRFVAASCFVACLALCPSRRVLRPKARMSSTVLRSCSALVIIIAVA